MFEDNDISAECSLLQGDICAAFPVPLISDETRIVDVASQGFLQGSVPTSAQLATHSQVALLIPVVRSNVIVLSQSCDLEDLERGAMGRILVAPLLPDDDGRFADLYTAATESAGEAFGKKLAKMVKNSANAEAEFQKAQGKIESSRKKALEALWLGQVEGAFPIASKAPIDSRSICYFDNAVSVPHTWLPLLKAQRRLRLRTEWASVLQEKLTTWLGRYAFPGSKQERLQVGGLE